MNEDIPEEYRVEHYPNPDERIADGWIHAVGIALASAGGLWLVSAALLSGSAGLAMAAALYGVALVAMLSFSALYNFSRIGPARPFLRRLDEAGIFLLIAGSYTPFTSQRLHGAWAVGMTSLVWAIAAAGIACKFAFPRISERAWTAVYGLYGWIAVAVIWPLITTLPPTALTLLVLGGNVVISGQITATAIQPYSP